MVKVIDYGTELKRPKRYYKCGCCHCGATIVFEYGDIWFEEPTQGIGRVECPVCRSKVFMDFWSDNLSIPVMCYPKQADESEYKNAYTDTSKRGIEALMAEKAAGTSPLESMAKAARETDAPSSVNPEEYKELMCEKREQHYSFGKTSTDDGSEDAVKLRHPFGNENI